MVIQQLWVDMTVALAAPVTFLEITPKLWVVDLFAPETLIQSSHGKRPWIEDDDPDVIRLRAGLTD